MLDSVLAYRLFVLLLLLCCSLSVSLSASAALLMLKWLSLALICGHIRHSKQAVQPSCVATLSGHSEAVYCLAHLSNSRICSGSEDGSLRIWGKLT